MVTKNWIESEILKGNERAQHIVGRALVCLLKRQTDSEKNLAQAHVENGIGFTKADAKAGTITAKFYMRHGFLHDWQVAKWTRPMKNGHSRIAKYWKQLSEEANIRKQQYLSAKYGEVHG